MKKKILKNLELFDFSDFDCCPMEFCGINGYDIIVYPKLTNSYIELLNEQGIFFKHQLADPFICAFETEKEHDEAVEKWNDAFDIEYTYILKKV